MDGWIEFNCFKLRTILFKVTSYKKIIIHIMHVTMLLITEHNNTKIQKTQNNKNSFEVGAMSQLN